MCISIPPEGWALRVLNSTVDPTDTLGKEGKDDASTIYGGSPHLHGVESIHWHKSNNTESDAVYADEGSSFVLSSLDVPIVSTGTASPFISPRTRKPDMDGGVHYNIFQNIWNTNYVLWYPFRDEDVNTRSRFHLEINA